MLWLTEWLAERMDLTSGMRVLDLGCGKALSSIFLAREFGVEVWATDLWIGATENLERIREAGAEGAVHPVHADAHNLPYAEGYFDAAVSLDAYQYFGTDDLYVGRFSRLVMQWHRHWEKAGRVTVERADFLDDGWRHWMEWQELRVAEGITDDQAEAEMLRVDEGRTLVSARVVATTGEGPPT